MVYLFLFFLLRMLRRDAGHIGISDMVVVVLIADAAQNAMASEYTSLTGQLREKGVRSVDDVETCYLGSNGRISVIPRRSSGTGT